MVTLYAEPNYTRTLSYDAEGNLAQTSKVYSSGSVITYTLAYAWEPGTHRMTAVTRTENTTVNYTATLEYDRMNRIRQLCEWGGACKNFSYVGDSDWISVVKDQYGNLLQRYEYANGRPSRLDFNNVNTPNYYRYDWHGNATFVGWDGNGGTDWTNFGAWGDADNYYNQGYYSWNAAWGYLKGPLNFNFNVNDGLDMGLFYAHGRWYNQDTGLFLSPDDKGEYFYGSGDDAINFAWCAIHFVRGTAAQFAWDETLGLPGSFHLGFDSDSNECYDPGREYGRSLSTVTDSYLMAQGVVDLGTGLTGGTLAVACEVGSFGFCSAVAIPTGGASLVLVTKGTVEAAIGYSSLSYIQKNPLSFARSSDPTLSYGSNTRDTTRNAQILRRSMGVGETPGLEAHHLVPSTHQYDAARRAREILQRLGIDINARENGVLLPKAIHDGLANDQTYMRAVLSDLEGASTRQQAEDILRRISQRLSNGTFPRK